MREDASGGRRRDEVHGSTKQSRVTRGGEGLRMRCTNTWRHDKISTHNQKNLGGNRISIQSTRPHEPNKLVRRYPRRILPCFVLD